MSTISELRKQIKELKRENAFLTGQLLSHGSELTNGRLFDLVRHQRAELHEAKLITDKEYAELCSEHPLAQGDGSPSPRRLEDYDELKARTARLKDSLDVLTEASWERENSLRELERNIAELRKDKERLDWMNKYPKTVGHTTLGDGRYWFVYDKDGSGPIASGLKTLREAIDAAMEEALRDL